VIDLVPLALLMGLVTFPSRAIPLLVSRFGRLPPPALAYLRLVGPAVLAALAAVNTMVVVTTAADGTRTSSFHVGVEWLAVAGCLAIVVWRKNLLLGIVVSVGAIVTLRALGVA
jgi:branched-subunit amino acid transport protein